MRGIKTSAGLLLCAFMLGGCAQQNTGTTATTADDVKQFLDLENQLWEAWNKNLNPKDAAPFYSQDPKNLYFDFAPMKFTSWAEYERVAGASLSGSGGHAVTKINDDFTVIKGGNDLAVTAFTFHVDFYGADGQVRGMDARETDVWKKEGDKWVIVHQHMSFPTGGSEAAEGAEAAPAADAAAPPAAN
jgi:ketosteroid isomerase-like protein